MFNLDQRGQRCLPRIQRIGAYGQIGHPLRPPGMQVHGAPHARGDVARPPVPAEMVGGLAYEVAHHRIAWLIAIRRGIVARDPVWHRLHLRQQRGDGRTENNAQRVALRLQSPFHTRPPCAMRVVGAQQGRSVEFHLGEGVEAFEHQLGVRPGEGRGRDVERGPILPVGQADPLQLRLGRADVRIRDQPLRQQIGMHASGHLRWAPCGRFGMRCGLRTTGQQAEFPACIQCPGQGGHAEQQGQRAQQEQRKRALQSHQVPLRVDGCRRVPPCVGGRHSCVQLTNTGEHRLQPGCTGWDQAWGARTTLSTS